MSVPSYNAELVLDCRVDLGEGPIWDAKNQVLYWVNIMENEVHVYNPVDNSDRVINVGQHVGTVVARESGGLMLALHHGFASLDLDTEEVSVITDPEPDIPGNRFNDGKCDPRGRFWAGTMPIDEGGATGSLYVLDTDLGYRKMVEGVQISNGIVWSPDETQMYFIDTPLGTVDAFDFDADTGEIENRRPVITLPEGQGFPDGMTGDVEGMLWVAHWGGSRITRWNPNTGEHLATVHVPAAQVTACAFSGPNLDQLYITCARRGLSEEALAETPHAGSLFVAEVGVQGVEAFEFAG
ncbi:MAG: SMP-30/gluconolactonase/LRE family protein [Chloroflexota bacterium]